MASMDISLNNLIRAVSKELITSRQERLESGQLPIFEVEELTLEVCFVVTASLKDSEGFDLKIIKADTKTNYDAQTVHKISLKLKSLTNAQDILKELGNELPLRPRSTVD